MNLLAMNENGYAALGILAGLLGVGLMILVVVVLCVAIVRGIFQRSNGESIVSKFGGQPKLAAAPDEKISLRVWLGFAAVAIAYLTYSFFKGMA